MKFKQLDCRIVNWNKGILEISVDLHGKLAVFNEVHMRWDFVYAVDDIIFNHGDFFADIVELLYNFIRVAFEHGHALEIFHKRTSWSTTSTIIAIATSGVIRLVNYIYDLRAFYVSEEGVDRCFDTCKSSLVLIRVQCELSEAIPRSKSHDFFLDEFSVFWTRCVFAWLKHTFEYSHFTLDYDPKRISLVALFE